MKEVIAQVKKRNGRLVDFNSKKIKKAIFKAITVAEEGDGKLTKELTEKVINLLKKRFKAEIPSVENIQDIVEEVLVLKGYTKTAKAYILYREQHRRIRETKEATEKAIGMVDQYLEELDWEVNENSNMAYSLQGLNNYVTSSVIKKYWLSKIYPPEIRKANQNGDFHIHDLQVLGPYCVGWDLYDLLLQGFGGVFGKVESSSPKHFSVALGQIVNFFYTLQGETAGAVALSNFDTLLAPFIHYDQLSYPEVKQEMQEFLFNCNVPTRVGFQTPFTNITLDLKIPKFYKTQPVIIGGKVQDEVYGEFQDQMDMINRAFAELMMEGDAKGRPFTFPIPTYNITRDFDWENSGYESIWKMTAKYGIPYFANFVNSEMSPDDVRSMCCRLRLDNRQLYTRGGGLFGSNPLTGSIGVTTINLPRIGYLSKTKKEFFDRLENIIDLARESLEVKRKTLEQFTEKGLYPYSKHYLKGIKKMRGHYWANHFSTIGIVGMNEALLNFKQIQTNLGTKAGQEFAEKILNFMREKMVKYQAEDGGLYNLEATPAEGTSYRLAKIDKKKYPDIITLGIEKPYYTNSSQIPVNLTDDLFEALEWQDNLQTKYTGGCIETGNKVLTDKGLLNIECIVENFDKLKPIKALSYNVERKVSEWDEILEGITIDVKRYNKIKIKGERNLDIVTSDWHPFFVMERIKVNPTCPVCEKKVGNIKGFAAHLKYNMECREEYKTMFKYKVIEKRADELKVGDYILQNSNNLYPEKETKLNNELMWLLGFFIGDGCISKYIDNRGKNNLKKYKVRFYSSSKAALEKASKIFSKCFQAKVKVIQNDKRSMVLKELTTSKKDAVEFFFRYGFTSGKKVYNINIPQKVKENLNKNNIFSFLSGLIDSDGHIDARDGSFEYYSVSSQLADDILEICSRAGIMISKKEKSNRRNNEVNIYRLRIPQYQMTQIRDKLTNTINFSRIKKDLSNRKKRYLPVVRVKEVSKADIKDNQFYDLTTKNNHNYLAGKNTLVFIHNTVFHAFLGERISDPNQVKKILKKVFDKFRLPYFTLTPTFSICPIHGYIAGEHFTCPKCIIEQPCEVYSRVVGYLRPVQQWNQGKKEEFKERKEFEIKK